jgi:hypothetical protein
LHYQLCQVSGECLRRWMSRTKICRASLQNDNFFWIDADTKYLSNMLFICVTNSIKLVWDAQEDGRREQRSEELLFKRKFQRDTNTKD